MCAISAMYSGFNLKCPCNTFHNVGYVIPSVFAISVLETPISVIALLILLKRI